MKKKILSLMAGAMLLATSSAFALPNLVANPGFENSYADWSFIGMGLGGSYWAHSGNNSVATGCVGHGCVDSLGSGSFVGQTLNTTAGTSYDLSFWVGENTGATSEMSVFWNGAMIADILNPANNSLNTSGMLQYTFSGLLATSSLTGLEVHGRQDPGGIGFDDFSVTASQAPADVPEPASAAILLTGLGMMGFLARRKQR
jgi:hypothetical protein